MHADDIGALAIIVAALAWAVAAIWIVFSVGRSWFRRGTFALSLEGKTPREKAQARTKAVWQGLIVLGIPLWLFRERHNPTSALFGLFVIVGAMSVLTLAEHFYYQRKR